MCLAFVGEDATQDIFIIAKVAYAIFTGQGIGTDSPLDVNITETQNQVGAFPNESVSKQLEMFNLFMISELCSLTWYPNWHRCAPPSNVPH